MSIILVLIFVVLMLGWKLSKNAAPTIELKIPLKGIGRNTPVEFEIRDARSRIKSVQVEVLQGGRSFTVPHEENLFGEAPRSRWSFWEKPRPSGLKVAARIGRQEIPELQEGRATLRITATNDSWSRFFRGGRSVIALDLAVRFASPQVEVLTSQHYINQGGSELVLFRVSPGTAESGVQVGTYFFPSWPVKPSAPETRLCLFAYPYSVALSTPAHIVARDDAGNETLAPFTYKVFPKAFHQDTLNVTDDFMARVVPAILSQTPELSDQGSLLKNFLMENGRLRRSDARELVAISQKTSPQFLWAGPFVELRNSKVEASFADHRTYVYNGQVIDHQDHLGYDLAVTAQTPVVAANDGVVVYASFLGIYGNSVILDHGCGLQTLYGHLSSMEVKPGDGVKRGQVIGRSGQTGLARGDHLHFSVLLDGIPVNPTEWWDPHWIHDRIEAKLAPYS